MLAPIILLKWVAMATAAACLWNVFFRTTSKIHELAYMLGLAISGAMLVAASLLQASGKS